MKQNSRLSSALHVLLHMAEREGPVTSEVLAHTMSTHPVVLRRMMAGLRAKGYVQSEKGHGGGWTLACALAEVTLRDVYEALGAPSLLAMGNRAEAPGCAVEDAVHAALGSALDEAESLLLTRFGELTLAALRDDVHSRVAARTQPSIRTFVHRAKHPAGAHGHGGHSHGAAQPGAVLEDPARDTWQRPDDVVRALKCKPTMTVAEVGAGTGYFAVRLAREVPLGEVIATDLARENVQALRERARREGLANLRVVRATKRASGLSAESVDRVLVAHVWHHMTDHDACVRDLVAAMRPGARLVVLEFHPGAHRGPPASLRVAPAEVIAVLKRAGLSAKVSPVEITDQYLVEARRRVPNARS